MRVFVMPVFVLLTLLLLLSLPGCGGGAGSGSGARGIATRQDTGQVLPNATIRLREIGDNNLLKENGHTASATTNGQGQFAIAIAPGRYSLDAVAYNVPGVPDKIFQGGNDVTITANSYLTVNTALIPYDLPTAKVTVSAEESRGSER